jgi:hypothetical protein
MPLSLVICAGVDCFAASRSRCACLLQLADLGLGALLNSVVAVLSPRRLLEDLTDRTGRIPLPLQIPTLLDGALLCLLRLKLGLLRLPLPVARRNAARRRERSCASSKSITALV